MTDDDHAARLREDVRIIMHLSHSPPPYSDCLECAEDLELLDRLLCYTAAKAQKARRSGPFLRLVSLSCG